MIEGKKNGRAYTDNKVIAAIQHTVPYLNPFVIGEPGVVNTQVIAKQFAKTKHNLRGERNLRQEVKHLRAAFQRLPDQVDIDFSFTAAGNTVEQGRFVLPEMFE